MTKKDSGKGSVREKLPRNWGKTLNRFLLIALLLSAITAPVVVYWSDQRAEMHARWETQLRLVTTIVGYGTETLADLVSSPNWPNNGNATMSSLILSIASSLSNLMYLDWDHAGQINRIWGTLEALGPSYVLNLTSTQRLTLAQLIHSMGDDLGKAYSNFTNYTSSDAIAGPPFWYNGPSPPDESLLEQADDLANLPGLPTLQV